MRYILIDIPEHFVAVSGGGDIHLIFLSLWFQKDSANSGAWKLIREVIC